ncbi:MAG: helix-turn-helix transcriptional regulator, partial [Treponema sp.]|nr:helix-turn-helix transcriptional regulator [Treponema sp.]
YMNPFYFSVYFKKNSGIRFKDCLTRIRMEHALNILREEDIETWELAERVGFQDPRYFSGLFKKIFGKTPTKYKQEMKW